jgi:hypothetical protein
MNGNEMNKQPCDLYEMDWREVVAKIRVLRKYTKQTGFRTTRSEKELLSRLGTDELAAALLELENGTENEYAKQ